MNLNFESCDVNISLMGKEVIWTDMGLDGACSYSIFNWIKKHLSMLNLAFPKISERVLNHGLPQMKHHHMIRFTF